MLFLYRLRHQVTGVDVAEPRWAACRTVLRKAPFFLVFER